MAFEGLTEKISSAFKKLRGQTRLTEADVKDAMREIRLALLEADVNFKVTKDFIKAVTEQATDAEILESLSPAQQVIKIVNDELIKLLGGKGARITIAPNPPTIVMMAGLQGSGKTTNAAKLAGLFKNSSSAAPCSSPVTFTVRQQSISSRSSVVSSTSRSLRWVRAIRLRSQSRVLLTHARTATTWCSWTPRADCISTKP